MGAAPPITERQFRAETTETSSIDETVRRIARVSDQELRERPWIRRAAQAGWVAKAIVYGAIAWAAMMIALDRPTPVDAEYTGLIGVLADGRITRWLLLVVAVGLVLYTSFRLLSVALIDECDADAWLHRVAYLFSAATYALIAWTAFRAFLRGGHHEGASTVEEVSRSLLDSSSGRIALFIGSVVAAGIGVYFAYKGLTRRFMQQVDDDGLAPWARRTIELTGAIGWLGRAAIVMLVAVFVGWAAIGANWFDARGFDRSLHRVADSTVGSITVGIIAASLFAYAAYCALTASRRRLAWEDNPEPEES